MLNNKIVGLDISDYSIEAVEMERKGSEEIIIAYGRSILEPGIIERGFIKDKKKLGEAIEKTFANAKPQSISTRQIVFGFPESRLFLHFFSLENVKDAELENAIKQEAANVIPISENDMVMAYKEIAYDKSVLGDDAKDMLVIATSLQFLNEWKKFFASQKLFLEFFDVESLASFRGIFDELPEKPVCLVDLGAETISLSIFSQAGLEYNYQMQYGGKYLTGKLASGLRIDAVQAEAIKRGVSFLPGERNVNAKEILQTAFTHVSEEIKRNLEFFLSKHPQFTGVEKIILIGGSSRFRGLSEFFTAKGLKGVVTFKKEDLKYQEPGLEYLEAIGLARRFFHGYWRDDPFFSNEKRAIFEKIFRFQNFIKSFDVKKIKLSPRKMKVGLVSVILLLLVYGFFSRNTSEPMQTEQPEKIINPEIEKIENNSEIQEPVIPILVPVIKKIRVQEIGASLNVRQNPEKTASVVFRLNPGTIHDVIAEKPGWYQIAIEKDKSGWVVAEYVDVVGD